MSSLLELVIDHSDLRGLLEHMAETGSSVRLEINEEMGGWACSWSIDGVNYVGANPDPYEAAQECAGRVVELAKRSRIFCPQHAARSGSTRARGPWNDTERPAT